MPGLAALLGSLALAATPETITQNIMSNYEAAPHTFGPDFLERIQLGAQQHSELEPLFREFVDAEAGADAKGKPPPPPPPNGAFLSGVFSDRAVLQRAPAAHLRDKPPARTPAHPMSALARRGVGT